MGRRRKRCEVGIVHVICVFVAEGEREEEEEEVEITSLLLSLLPIGWLCE